MHQIQDTENTRHTACQHFRLFVLEFLESNAECSCTCLSNDRNTICQRFPNLAPLVRHLYKNAEAFLQALPLAVGTHESEQDVFSDYGGTDHGRAERDEEPDVIDIEQVSTRGDGTPSIFVDNHSSEVPSTTDKMNGNAQRTMKSCTEGVDHPPSVVRATSGDDSCRSNEEDRLMESGAQNSTRPGSGGFAPGLQTNIVDTSLNGIEPTASGCTNVDSELQTHHDHDITPQKAETSSNTAPALFWQEQPEKEDGYLKTPDIPVDELTPCEKHNAVVRLLPTSVNQNVSNAKVTVSLENNAQEEEQRDRQHSDDIEANESGRGAGEAEEDISDEDADEYRDEEEEKGLGEAETAGQTSQRQRHKRSQGLVNGAPTPLRKSGGDSTRRSKKRLHRGSPLGTSPMKKPKVSSNEEANDLPSEHVAAGTELQANQSYWDEWDMRREEAHHIQNAGKSIKAVQVLRRLSSRQSLTLASSRSRQGLSPRHVDALVTMVLAVANGHAFGALKEVIQLLQQDRVTWTPEIFSDDPKALVGAVTAIETAGNLNSYLRRFALARLAKLYHDTAANKGVLVLRSDTERSSSRGVATKAHKAKAFRVIIQSIWGVSFPGNYKDAKMTKRGLIDSDSSNAVHWNNCKTKLRKQIEGGQRWLELANRFGWSSLGLVTRDWLIGNNKVVASDRVFEEVLTASEHAILLDEIDTAKGRFLRQLNKALGGSLFDLLKDSTSAQGLPLLRLDDQDIMSRPDCDPQWVNELTCL